MQLGASPSACDAIAYAVNEALINAVMHGYVERPPGELVVEAWPDDADHLLVRVSDEGRGMVPRPRQAGLGLGLNLMTKLADDVRFRNEPDRPGTTVSMRFSLGGSAAKVDLAGSEPPSPASFEIHEHSDDGRRIIAPRGELDLARATELQRRLDQVARSGEATTLDLSQLSFIDSSGITLLVRNVGWADSHGWKLHVENPSPEVLRVMELAGVAELIGLAPQMG